MLFVQNYHISFWYVREKELLCFSPFTGIRLAVGDYSGDIQKRLDYTSDSNVYEIFPDSFISEFTKASNFTDFCEMIGCDITSQTDLDKLQDDAYFDNAIQNNSEFTSWQDMVETAYQRLFDKK